MARIRHSKPDAPAVTITRARAFRLKIRLKICLKICLKIPRVTTPESGQQEIAPDRGGGRAARDDLASGYAAGVSTALLSTARSLAAGILNDGLGSQRAVRGKHQFRLRAHLQGEGRQSSVWETHQDQLPNRAGGTKTPRSRLAGSPLQYAPARLHFHPLPCLAQTSRFLTPVSSTERRSRSSLWCRYRRFGLLIAGAEEAISGPQSARERRNRGLGNALVNVSHGSADTRWEPDAPEAPRIRRARSLRVAHPTCQRMSLSHRACSGGHSHDTPTPCSGRM
jgi:hypothetical protein